MRPGTVQRIFDDHYPAVEAAQRLDGRSRRAAWNIRTCRTPAQGYHIDACPNGDYRVRLNNSCKHRACPLCGATETELWLERQSAKELRCAHHQTVFTSPDELRAIWRWNRRLFTNLYFLAAWHALRELLANPRWLGALPGVIAVFQSWGDELQEHLHLHFIITCGGLSPDGKWIAADLAHLLPVAVLAAKFRGKFLAYLREALRPHTANGLYHSACRHKLNQARSRLGQPPYEPEAEPPDTHELLHRMFPEFTGDLCPKCHTRLVTISVIRPGHSPPRRKAA